MRFLPLAASRPICGNALPRDREHVMQPELPTSRSTVDARANVPCEKRVEVVVRLTNTAIFDRPWSSAWWILCR